MCMCGGWYICRGLPFYSHAADEQYILHLSVSSIKMLRQAVNIVWCVLLDDDLLGPRNHETL